MSAAPQTRKIEAGPRDGNLAIMVYELTTLDGSLASLRALTEGAHDWLRHSSGGTLLGSWRTEVGALGRIVVLRDFETRHQLSAERRRALTSRDPFNGGPALRALSMETYEGFPFLPQARPRQLGGLYEVRTYVLKPGGLTPTLEAWEKAVEPAKDYTDHLVTNMFATDGPSRITHIWGFESMQQRAALRERYQAAGLWPPKGAPDLIATATSSIMLPNPGSPLS
ncbi:NIPSNAP family protein [Kineosporia sp. NBRC 101731]|uniref:NIPSNAP family protein n=1 Tax=Kineosporia sp. NBRC 101731 TaxID=3032199 RepID=UPI0025553541|nr:NIPSNAP family protein [Kineosporia sp. NBRC 101731]